MYRENDLKSLTDKELFKIYKQTKDTKVRDIIIERYTYVAQVIAKHFCGRGIEYEDLYQVGCIGLLLAAERFDAEKGVKFTTFATPTISGEIKRYFRDKGNFIRVPRRLYEIFSRANRIHMANLAESKDEKSDAVLPKVVSFEQEFMGEEMQIANTLGQSDDGFLMVEERDFVERCMEILDEREKEFAIGRYYDEKTQKQLAEQMGVSQMQISRMEKKVLKKLRDMYFKDI